MAQVPNHLLRDWIVQLNDVAGSQHVDPGMAAELRGLAARANAFLTETSLGGTSDKRRGLGRGLEALIPTDSRGVDDIVELRERLRRIAASVTPTDSNSPERSYTAEAGPSL